MKPWFKRFAEINQQTLDDDQALNEWMRSHLATAIHACGTCKMGPSSRRRSRGRPVRRDARVTGLRVADTSIFPAPRAVPRRLRDHGRRTDRDSSAPARQPNHYHPSPGDISHA